MSFKFENLIAWGDCDSAGIVYYPKYFYWIDTAFQALLREAGFTHHSIYQRYGARVPIVDAGAKFISSATYDDRLLVEAKIVHWGARSFRVIYHGTRYGIPIFEGNEVRVWALFGEDGSITPADIVPEFKAALAAVGG